MESTMKLMAVLLILSTVGLAIRKTDPQYTYVLGIAGFTALALSVVCFAEPILTLLESLWSETGLSQTILATMLKVTVVSVFSKIAADFCDDSGQHALSSTVSFSGGILCIYLSIPLISSVIDLLKEGIGGFG